MTLTTLQDESICLGGFYVPLFEIKIEKAGLPQDVLRDVLDVTYSDHINEIDGFEITVNNWGPSEQRADKLGLGFKYAGSETAETLQAKTPEGERFRLFEPCNKTVEVRMGYLEHVQTMVLGHFTAMEPSFTAGASTMKVRGLNVLHQLRSKQYTSTWEGCKDSQIAENIATLRDPQTGQKRFPLPIAVDRNSMKKEQSIPYVAQKNQYDVDFLFGRARERGYVIYIQEAGEDEDGHKHPQQLYFGPSRPESQVQGMRSVTYNLKWGISLLDFRPTLSTAKQVSCVTVRGWNQATHQRIKETASLDDRHININCDLRRVLGSCDPRQEREEIVVDEPVFTPAQARDRAAAILLDRQRDLIKATGTTVGLPDLRAGQRICIDNLGARFSGTYFVTDTTHTINDSGYTTKFTARREEPCVGGGTAV